MTQAFVSPGVYLIIYTIKQPDTISKIFGKGVLNAQVGREPFESLME